MYMNLPKHKPALYFAINVLVMLAGIILYWVMPSCDRWVIYGPVCFYLLPAVSLIFAFQLRNDRLAQKVCYPFYAWLLGTMSGWMTLQLDMTLEKHAALALPSLQPGIISFQAAILGLLVGTLWRWYSTKG